jgi:hypothetical protein
MGLLLIPLAPWQPAQVTDLAFPAAASPAKLAQASVDKRKVTVRFKTFFIGDLQKLNIKIKIY